MTAELTVAPWTDSLVERLGRDPASVYVETYWLPILGPTSTWLYRRLGLLVVASDAQWTVPVDELAASLGIGGRRVTFDRSLGRLVRFGAARWNGDVLEVRRALPTLAARDRGQLPQVLRDRHERDVTLRSRRLVPA